MILCHKCGGILAATKNEDCKGLHGCSCISGYVRGYEPELTREQAIESQIKYAEENVLLYMRQNRPLTEINQALRERERLRALK